MLHGLKFRVKPYQFAVDLLSHLILADLDTYK